MVVVPLGMSGPESTAKPESRVVERRALNRVAHEAGVILR